jgi:hypothetical protein
MSVKRKGCSLEIRKKYLDDICRVDIFRTDFEKRGINARQNFVRVSYKRK